MKIVNNIACKILTELFGTSSERPYSVTNKKAWIYGENTNEQKRNDSISWQLDGLRSTSESTTNKGSKRRIGEAFGNPHTIPPIFKQSKRAYSRIDKAYDHQKAVVKRLEAADKAQVKAMYASARHAEYRVNPYLADTNHAQTSVRWK